MGNEGSPTPDEQSLKADGNGSASSAVAGFCSISIEDREEGAGLFKNKTFGGNGRTCATCHPADGAFTLSPADVQARFDANSQDPLFLFDGSDDGTGNGVTRILSEATVLIARKLPEYMSIAACPPRRDQDPPCDTSARTVVLPRAIPSLFNIGVEAAFPAVEGSLSASPAIMLDLRFANLADQALGAVRDHYEPKHDPQPEQRDTIATLQASGEFFSSPALAELACGGPDPGLPEGTTDSERRGRRFFVPQPQGVPEHFTCANCHAGPLLNEVRNSPAGPIVPDGLRFIDNLVSTIRAPPQRLIDFKVKGIDGREYILTSGDPGRLLVEQGNFRCAPTCETNPMGFVRCGGCVPCSNLEQFNPALAGRDNNVCFVVPGAQTGFARVNATKIPSLRGISRTAPFFHDHSAQTLDDVVRHYQKFFEFHFQRTNGALDARLSERDVQDIVAFMKLL